MLFCRIAGADIKDKQPLMDARKSIEKDMERFKICEREMKQAGRAGAPKAADPKEKAKEDARDWINNSVDAITAKVSCKFILALLHGHARACLGWRCTGTSCCHATCRNHAHWGVCSHQGAAWLAAHPHKPMPTHTSYCMRTTRLRSANMRWRSCRVV